MIAAFLFLENQFRTFLSVWEGIYAWRLCRFTFDRNLLFREKLYEMPLVCQKKCIATYSVSELWDRG